MARLDLEPPHRKIVSNVHFQLPACLARCCRRRGAEMRAAWACALVVAVLVAAGSVQEAHALVDANNQTLRSINGCECLSECGYSFDVCV